MASVCEAREQATEDIQVQDDAGLDFLFFLLFILSLFLFLKLNAQQWSHL